MAPNKGIVVIQLCKWIAGTNQDIKLKIFVLNEDLLLQKKSHLSPLVAQSAMFPVPQLAKEAAGSIFGSKNDEL